MRLEQWAKWRLSQARLKIAKSAIAAVTEPPEVNVSCSCAAAPTHLVTPSPYSLRGCLITEQTRHL